MAPRQRDLAVASLAAAALSLPASPAAQWRSENDAEICVRGTGNASLDISVCGRALEKPGLTEHTRATLHAHRGGALRRFGVPMDALGELNRALSLNPLSAHALDQRGLVHHALGNWNAAIRDFARASQLFPSFADAHRHRGTSLLFRGDYETAQLAFARAISIAPDHAETHALLGIARLRLGRHAGALAAFETAAALALPYDYLPIWRHLAAEAAGRSDPGILAEAIGDLSPEEWPAPLIRLYLGEADPGEVDASAQSAHRAIRARRRHEADFYVGKHLAVRGAIDAARARFDRVADGAATTSFERMHAEAELRALDAEQR